jgi:hypothetical protein
MPLLKANSEVERILHVAKRVRARGGPVWVETQAGPTICG